jgi:hypothetical protein
VKKSLIAALCLAVLALPVAAQDDPPPPEAREALDCASLFWALSLSRSLAEERFHPALSSFDLSLAFSEEALHRWAAVSEGDETERRYDLQERVEVRALVYQGWIEQGMVQEGRWDGAHSMKNLAARCIALIDAYGIAG